MATHYRDIADGLEDVSRSTLQAVDSDWNVESRFRLTERAANTIRNDIMGDPIKYVRILFVGDVEDSDRFQNEDLAGRKFEGAYSFLFQGWREFDDQDTYAGSPTENWDNSIWDPNPEDDPDGLVPHFRAAVGMTLNSGTHVAFDQPSDVQNDFRELGDKIAHYFEFTMIAAASPAN